MRILHVVNSLAYGGAEKLAVELSAGLNHGRHQSLICCLGETGALAEEAARWGVPVFALGKRSGWDVRLVWKLAALIRRERVEVVHTHNMGPLIYGSLAGRLAGCRVVLNTRHGREEKRSPGFIWALTGSVVAISEDAKARLLRFNRVPSSKVRVIYNGVEVPASQNAGAGVRAELHIAPAAPVIGTVARLAPEKDHETLLRSFALVRARLPQAVLVLAGDGQLRSSLEALVAQLQIGEGVRFLGFRRDVPKVLAAFDVFALSSMTEGISLTLLEAMAAARPVVATRVGGNPEVVEDGTTGLLVPAGDPEAMAQALGTLLADPSRARRMGEAGRRRAEAQFSLSRMIEAYERCYETLGRH